VIDAVGNTVGDADADRRAWADDVLRSLCHLAELERGILTLSYFDQLTQAEIAARLGIPVSLVRRHAASGLQLLAGHLESSSVVTDLASRAL
jgi:DNA-directed RNA polymerase specialized sigma24 family protein